MDLISAQIEKEYLREREGKPSTSTITTTTASNNSTMRKY
jgi:hypothetical protein